MKTIIFLLFLTLVTNKVDAHKEWVHQYIVNQAYLLLENSVPNISSFYNSYFRDTHGNFYPLGQPSHHSVTMVAGGAWEEDSYDIVYGHCGFAPPPFDPCPYSSTTHFWNPDGSPYDNNTLEFTTGSFENAFEKAEVMWNGNQNIYMPGPFQFIDGQEQQKLEQKGFTWSTVYRYLIIRYNGLSDFLRNRKYYIYGVVTLTEPILFASPIEIESGDYNLDLFFAANILGRICHLLTDMSVPGHVRIKSHPCDVGYGERYEMEIGGKNWFAAGESCNDMPSTFPAQNFTYQHALYQGGIMKPWEKNSPLKYLFYTTAQITDVYNCYRADCDILPPYNCDEDIYSGDRVYNSIDPITGDNYSEMASIISSIPTTFSNWTQEFNNISINALVYTIRSVASLLYWFGVETGQIPLYVSGNIANNTTWIGTVYATGNVTVNSGVTLKIYPNTNITFQNSSSLTVKGTLNANSTIYKEITFDFVTPSGGNGIKFNSGSSGTINQCIIKNAGRGIECNSVMPEIRYTDIKNNSVGIWLNNVSSTPNKIFNNTIHGSSNGINCYYSSPHIVSNEIYSNGNGIFCLGSSPWIYRGTEGYINNSKINYNTVGIYLVNNSPAKVRSPNGTGYNAVYSNQIGLYADYMCNALVQGNDFWYNSSYHIRASNSVVVIAEGGTNWWGQYPANPNHFLATNGATIYYAPGRTGPWTSIPYSKISGTPVEYVEQDYYPPSIERFSFNPQILEAIKLHLEGKYDEAIAIYAQEFEKDKGNLEKGKFLLSQIAECYREAEDENIEIKSGEKNFIDYLGNEVRTGLSVYNDLYATTLELENLFLVTDRKYDKAIQNLEALKTRFEKNDYTLKNALFNLGYIYTELLKDVVKGKEAFAELKEKYPDDFLTYNAMFIMGEIDSIPAPTFFLPKEDLVKEEIPDKFDLLDNYPNPFNPVTIINYSLPVGERVVIKIFDILGREVTQLVNEDKPAGTYSISFDASSLSSGIYFYSITAGKFNQVKKMVLAK